MDRIRATALPCDDDGCGWWHLLPPPPPARRLETEQSADCVVVGAGFAGLAAARRIALLEPGWRVVLLEAQRAGYGASGRNSGFVGDIAHRDPALEIDDTRRMQRLCRAGIEALRFEVEAQHIECSWSASGRIHAAVEAHSLRNWRGLCQLLDATGESHWRMSEGELKDAIGTGHYRAGVHIPSTVLLQPAALARGLAAALPPNVDLFEESPVRSLERQGAWRVGAGRGTVTSALVIVTINGFAPSLEMLKRRIFPLFTFASLTRALEPDERQLVGSWPQWGLVSEDRMGTSLRRTADQRILIRNTVHYTPLLRVDDEVRRQAREQHRLSLAARWPALGGVEIEFTWSGVLGMTINQGHYFGRLADGLYASAGCNGTGVALGTALGALLAQYARDADSNLLRDALSLPPPGWLPPQPFLGWGVRSAILYLQARAGAER